MFAGPRGALGSTTASGLHSSGGSLAMRTHNGRVPAQMYRDLTRGLAILVAATVVVVAVSLGVVRSSTAASSADEAAPVHVNPLVALAAPVLAPRPTCQRTWDQALDGSPGDRPEWPYPVQLQGQVPWQHRVDGIAARGYSCNLSVIGTFGGTIGQTGVPLDRAAFANFDVYTDAT